jgi:multidrug efflux pump subunit AcrA (membrane-fusion protein)
MAELWRVAVEHADHLLQSRLNAHRAALTAAETRLADERTRWAATLAEAETAVAQAQAHRDSVEHACATLDGQLRDSHTLRDDVLQQRDRLQALADQQRAEIDALRAERASLDATSPDRCSFDWLHCSRVSNRFRYRKRHTGNLSNPLEIPSALAPSCCNSQACESGIEKISQRGDIGMCWQLSLGFGSPEIGQQ